jgi:uncharacterized RDD family membrane protein YckC
LSQLVTGEAVALDLRTAALPSRMVAGLVDGLAQLVLLAVVGGIATAVSVDVSSAAAAALGIVVLVLVLVVYPVAFETLLRGRTPGKAAMGLRVVRDDGGPIGFRQALVRGWPGRSSSGPGPSLFLLAIATMLLNERNSGSVTCWPARSSCRSGWPPAAARWPRCRRRWPAGPQGST